MQRSITEFDQLLDSRLAIHSRAHPQIVRLQATVGIAVACQKPF